MLTDKGNPQNLKTRKNKIKRIRVGEIFQCASINYQKVPSNLSDHEKKGSLKFQKSRIRHIFYHTNSTGSNKPSYSKLGSYIHFGLISQKP